jgi:SAM-dependent methyltransferase
MRFPTRSQIFDAINTSPAPYVDFLSASLTPGDAMLELGCGTGRILLPMAALGFQVTGIDRSLDMLRAARAKQDAVAAPGYIGLLCADFTGFELRRRYRRVFYSTDTLAMVEDVAARAGALRAAAGHLAAEGELVVSLGNPARYLREGTQTFDRQGQIPGVGSIRVQEQRVCDLARGLRIGHKREQFQALDGTILVRESVRPLAIVTVSEITLSLAAAGLRVRARYGDFDGSPLRDDSPRAIFVGGAA